MSLMHIIEPKDTWNIIILVEPPSYDCLNFLNVLFFSNIIREINRFASETIVSLKLKFRYHIYRFRTERQKPSCQIRQNQARSKQPWICESQSSEGRKNRNHIRMTSVNVCSFPNSIYVQNQRKQHQSNISSILLKQRASFNQDFYFYIVRSDWFCSLQLGRGNWYL